MIYGMKTPLVLRIKNGQIKRGRGITREYCVNRPYDVTWLDHLELLSTESSESLKISTNSCSSSLTPLIQRRLADVC
jgi:hypothetical protein